MDLTDLSGSPQALEKLPQGMRVQGFAIEWR